MSKTIEEGREEVAKLCAYYDAHKAQFSAHGVKEAHIRQKLIDPFFIALGWDVYNSRRVAPLDCEVIPEDSLDDEGHQKAPDYTFRRGRQRKFYAEAKKCTVNLRGDPSPAHQIRRYGWSGKLALSVLTNFDQLAVYDCTKRPAKQEQASFARLLDFNYDEYVERWEEIWKLLSRESVWTGTYDAYVSGMRRSGTSLVDEEFLNDIEEWRRGLALNIARHNSHVDSDKLGGLVQSIIDRIVFLRMAEDRNLEPAEQLLALGESTGIYDRFVLECKKADRKYNSGLFHFLQDPDNPDPPDTESPSLRLDDEVLKRIFKGLYFKYGSPYHFGVLPVEILGAIYEQFLGKVIRLTANRTPRIEMKPEVRKAGGVYYTPSYIVNYIVEQTVGVSVQGKSPMQLGSDRRYRHFRVADIACGSGSFLIGAYEYLLEYCLRWYISNAPEEHPKCVVRDPRNREWRLTIEEKKRILVTHIFGVDIDSQAVEVARLSLLLKMMEGEDDATLSLQQQAFGNERILPSLSKNVQCGNSLVEGDFFEDGGDLDEVKRVNPFDWTVAFPQVMRDGGFDCVVGNPPYIDSELMSEHYAAEREYCTSHFASASGNWDIFCVFIERALQLCRTEGYQGFIVPNKLMAAEYAASVRKTIGALQLRVIRDYSKVPVFPVAVYPVVEIVRKAAAPDNCVVLCEEMRQVRDMEPEVAANTTVSMKAIREAAGTPWMIGSSARAQALIKKLKKFPCLGDCAEVRGAATVSEAYNIAKLVRDAQGRSPKDIRFINSGTIDRYESLWGVAECRYLGKKFLRPVIPANRVRRLPVKRLEQARTPKVVIAGMTKRLECVADIEGRVLAGKSTSIVMRTELELRYLTAILNSRLVEFYYHTVFGGNALAGGYLRVGPPQLKTIPVVVPRTDNAEDSRTLSRIVQLVQSIETLRRESTAGETAQDAAVLRQVAVWESEVDAAIYGLFGLTTEERNLVEQATSSR